MPIKRSWSDNQLKVAIKNSTSYRQVLSKLKLRPTGGNYKQLAKHVNRLNLNIDHFKGHAWNKGLSGLKTYRLKMDEILVANSAFQSHKLKKRLFLEGIKQPICEICGWSERSIDGRIPVELDHINGVSNDNRINNLRILCPNCHSLQTTHRGKNIKR